MSVTIACIDPLDRAEGIKSLFLAHERPEFPAFFDRAYPDVVREGGESWVGLEGDEVVMHIARFPHLMRVGDEIVRGGLLANLMVKKSHRTFFPALGLVRRMLADTRAEGTTDFLFGDPHNSAPALLKAAGFTPVGTLRRYVLAVDDARAVVRAPLRTAHAVGRAQSGAWRLRGAMHPASDLDPVTFVEPPGRSARIRPYRPPALYPRRLAGFPTPTDRWHLLHQRNVPHPVAAALCRDTEVPGLVTLCALWRQPSLPVVAATLAAAREARRFGARRVQLWTLEESDFAHELRHAGFVPRHEVVPVLGLGITALGREVLAQPAAWETTHLDYDR